MTRRFFENQRKEVKKVNKVHVPETNVTRIVLASNLPRPAKPTKVVGAHMQRFCNCNPVKKRPEEQGVAKTKAS